MLADTPFVKAETLRDLLAISGPDEVKACRYKDGRPGSPACFGAQRLEILLNLTGDAGARHLLNQPGFVRGIAVSEIELIDIDTQEDVDKARGVGVRWGDAMH